MNYLLTPSRKIDWKFLFVAFTILVSINLWSFELIPKNIFRQLEAAVVLCLLFIVLYNHLILRKRLIFKNNVFLFMLAPILGSIGALAFHDQPLNLSLLFIRFILFWLFYFVLHVFDLSETKIIPFILFVGFMWAFITIVQQFTYPYASIAYFHMRSDSDTYSIYRAGVYRFMINGHQYGAFLLFFSFYRYLLYGKKSHLALLLFTLLGFYYYGARQFMIAAAVCLLIAIFMVKGKARLRGLVFLSIGTLILIAGNDFIIRRYIELTNEQWQYSDDPDQRVKTVQFFLFEYWPHWAAKIIGNGPGHTLSSYGQEMERLIEYNHFHRSDVGIVGAFNAYGIFHAINILWVNIKGLRKRYFTYENNFLMLLFFYSIILLPYSEFYTILFSIPFYCVVYYLVDKSFDKKQLLDDNKAAVNIDETQVSVII